MESKKHYTRTDIMRMRDKMSVEELTEQTDAVKNQYGYVSYGLIFKYMGFEHCHNGKYEKVD